MLLCGPQTDRKRICSCSYRYTLEDLLPMMNASKRRAEQYDAWASHVTETLEAKLEKKKGKAKSCEEKQTNPIQSTVKR